MYSSTSSGLDSLAMPILKSKKLLNLSGTTLQFLSSRIPKLGANALNHRTSAHYTEINSMYGHEMMKKVKRDRLRFWTWKKELSEKETSWMMKPRKQDMLAQDTNTSEPIQTSNNEIFDSIRYFGSLPLFNDYFFNITHEYFQKTASLSKKRNNEFKVFLVNEWIRRYRILRVYF